MHPVVIWIQFTLCFTILLAIFIFWPIFRVISWYYQMSSGDLAYFVFTYTYRISMIAYNKPTNALARAVHKFNAYLERTIQNRKNNKRNERVKEYHMSVSCLCSTICNGNRDIMDLIMGQLNHDLIVG